MNQWIDLFVLYFLCAWAGGSLVDASGLTAHMPMKSHYPHHHRISTNKLLKPTCR
jgi:hypothetical protein